MVLSSTGSYSPHADSDINTTGALASIKTATEGQRSRSPPHDSTSAAKLRPASSSLSPHRPAGRLVAACLTAHCACPRHLPLLLDVGGGEGLQEAREDPSGNVGRAGRGEEDT